MNRWIVFEMTLGFPLRPDRNVPVQAHAVIDLGQDPTQREAEFANVKGGIGWLVRAFFAEEQDAGLFAGFLNRVEEDRDRALLDSLVNARAN